MTYNKDCHDNEAAARSLIISNPAYYYAAESKTLEARLREQALSDEEIKNIEETQGGKAIRDALLGSFIVGKVVKTFLDFNDGVSKAVKDAKRSRLLEIYLNNADKTEKAVANLQRFVSDPQGSVLFNKVLQILDEPPP